MDFLFWKLKTVFSGLYCLLTIALDQSMGEKLLIHGKKLIIL